jgi:hypothetical protein
MRKRIVVLLGVSLMRATIRARSPRHIPRSFCNRPELRYILLRMPIIPAVAGSIADMKRLRDRCAEEGIRADVGCPPGAAGKG